MTPPGDDNDSGGPPSLYGYSDEQLSWILDFPGLVRALGEVAADHPLHPVERSRPADLHSPGLSGMAAHIERFLDRTEYPYLAITVRFTRDGLSLSRFRGGGLRADFGLDCRIVPEHESRVRTLFKVGGVAPREDYLSNGGRVRLLSFPVGTDLDALVALCLRVLLDVFAIEDSDSLVYTFGEPSKG